MYAQTQTKYFRLSDQGLKQHLYNKKDAMGLFKKIFHLGYNSNKSVSYEITGSKVRVILPTNHGFVAERVVLIQAENFSKEYFVESVDETSITINDENFPTSLAGEITVKVAPLGWELIYEQGKVLIYKVKEITGEDLYLRLLFPTSTSFKFAINPCLGREVDLELGIITDANSYTATKSHSTSVDSFSWTFNNMTGDDSYYVTRGYTENEGTAFFIGSLYHFIMCSSLVGSPTQGAYCGFLPVYNTPITNALPLLIVSTYNNMNSSFPWMASYTAGFINNTRVISVQYPTNTFHAYTSTATPFTTVDQTKLATIAQSPLYMTNSASFAGYVLGGYIANIPSSEGFPNNLSKYPHVLMDYKNEVKYFWALCSDSSNQMGMFIPLEEIKID